MIAQRLFHLVLKLYAREIVRAAYAGILRRDAEKGGLDAYARSLAATGDLPAVLGDIAASIESWEKHLYEHPDQFVHLTFQGLLERDPDPNDLRTCSGKLVETKDLPALLSTVGGSQEHWEMLVGQKSKELVRAVFRGLLGREPDLDALAFYSGQLAETKDLPALLSAVGGSQEHWEKLVGQKSEELVRAVFQGLLEREPDTGVLASYGIRLGESRDLTTIVKDVVRSEEFRKRSFDSFAPELVSSIYKGLLGREPDSKGLSDYSAQIAEQGNLINVLHSMIWSDEFKKKQNSRVNWPNPALSYDKETLVHLHIQKTAGSTINKMLGEAYQHTGLCFRNNETIYLHSPGELSTYAVFIGHLDFDSLVYIPRRTLSIFTFVRQPKKRILSLYYYWRSHEPGHSDFNRFMQLANNLTLELFCKNDVIKMIPEVWNHMTWAIMGRKQWFQWQTLLINLAGRPAEEIIAETIRPVIRKRLREFLFVGIQEDFERSADVLFQMLGRPRPKDVSRENSLEGRIASDPLFKNNVVKQPITTEVDAALDRLVQLDNVVYEEAQALFAARLTHYQKDGSLTAKKT